MKPLSAGAFLHHSGAGQARTYSGFLGSQLRGKQLVECAQESTRLPVMPSIWQVRDGDRARKAIGLMKYDDVVVETMTDWERE